MLKVIAASLGHLEDELHQWRASASRPFAPLADADECDDLVHASTRVGHGASGLASAFDDVASDSAGSSLFSSPAR